VGLNEKFQELIDLLSEKYIGRSYEAEALIVGALTGYPVIWIGPWGIAKTAMIDSIVYAIKGAKLFRYLLHKFTEPEEIVGPWDIATLREKGIMIRRTAGKLPSANIVYLDEPFKASSAIRNFLLDIILYKRFFDGERYVDVDVKAIFMSTNELPVSEEDKPFVDRACVRIFSDRLDQSYLPSLISAVIKFENVGYRLPREVVTIEELERAQREVVELEEKFDNDDVKDAVTKIYASIKRSNRPIDISERRVGMWLKAASAISWLYGEEPDVDHVAYAALLTLPESKESMNTVLSAINEAGIRSSVTYYYQVKTVMAEAENIIDKLSHEEYSNLNARRIVENLADKLEELIERAPKRRFLKPVLNSARSYAMALRYLLDELK